MEFSGFLWVFWASAFVLYALFRWHFLSSIHIGGQYRYLGCISLALLFCHLIVGHFCSSLHILVPCNSCANTNYARMACYFLTFQKAILLELFVLLCMLRCCFAGVRTWTYSWFGNSFSPLPKSKLIRKILTFSLQWRLLNVTRRGRSITYPFWEL